MSLCAGNQGWDRRCPCSAQHISTSVACQATSISSCPFPQPLALFTGSSSCCSCLLWPCQLQLCVWLLPAGDAAWLICPMSLGWMLGPGPKTLLSHDTGTDMKHQDITHSCTRAKWHFQMSSLLFSYWCQFSCAFGGSRGKGSYRAVLEILPLRFSIFPEGFWFFSNGFCPANVFLENWNKHYFLDVEPYDILNIQCSQ